MSKIVKLETYEKLVQNRVKKTEKKVGGPEDGDIDPDFIMTCLSRNELGDGELFKRLYRKEFVFNKAMDSWLVWAGHHWQLDKMSEASAAVEGVARVYQGEAKRLTGEIKELMANEKDWASLAEDRKQLNARVSALRSSRRRSNCLLFAHTTEDPLAIEGSEIDQRPWLLPCPNGVVDLKTGELESGRQEDYLMKACLVPWPEEGIKADAGPWEIVLDEIFSGNQKLVEFFWRVCGYALIGEVRESIFVVMTGQGRNGKSMIVETISKILGPLSGAIRSEMLLDQNRVASSAGPTPDIMALRGLRFAFASETDDGCKISPARVKWITGNDTITGRNPHDKYPQEFPPSHTLFLLTNHKPRASSEDFALWERMVLLPFDLSFVTREPERENERRADPGLGRSLEKIQPAILSWAVRGCLKYQKNGLKLPAAVKEATSEYRASQDSVGDFIDECCVVNDGCKVNSTKIYTVFEVWWKKNISNFVPKQKKFGGWMSKRFKKETSGTVTYLGIGLKAGLEGVEDPDDMFKD